MPKNFIEDSDSLVNGVKCFSDINIFRQILISIEPQVSHSIDMLYLLLDLINIRL
jgi:hypothetical protein